MRMLCQCVVVLALMLLAQVAFSANTVVIWGSNGNGQCDVPPGLTEVTKVAVGYRHVVALKSDGTVVAWGSNANGECDVPAGLANVTAVAAGTYHTVALRADHTVVTWGGNAYSVPEGLANVTAVAAGETHTVALKADGTVAAWGYNGYGQCNVPAGLTGVTAIAAGYYHTVALKADGTVVAWGDSDYGQCAIPDGLAGVTAIAAGGRNTVALKADGTVVAWGGNGSGQCNVPAGLTGVTAIAAGETHAAARKADGTVVIWGNDDSGQCTVPDGLPNVAAIAAGNGLTAALVPVTPLTALTLTKSSVPDHLPAGTTVGRLAATGGAWPLTYTLVAGEGDADNAAFSITGRALLTAAVFEYLVRQQYSIRVRATDAVGMTLEQAFTITVTEHNDPPSLQVPGLQTIPEDTSLHLSPDTGTGSTLSDPDAGAAALLRVRLTAIDGTLTLSRLAGLTLEEGTGTADRTVVVCGTQDALNAALADISCTPRAHFVGLTGLQITVDDQGQTGDGGPQAATATIPIMVTAATPRFFAGWGSDNYSQSEAPALLTGRTVAIAAGDAYAVVLKEDGTVIAWGPKWGAGGTPAPSPQAGGTSAVGSGYRDMPAGLTDVTAVAAGGAHAVALKADGTVAAWGNNNTGQCDVPAGLTGVIAIAAGEAHTVALKADGTVVVWGYNGYGQCNVPDGLTGVTGITAGYNHTVALKADGSVVAWGSNDSGQCDVPAGLTGVAALAAGAYHTVALKTDGTVTAWGGKGEGETDVPAGLTGVTAIAAGCYHTVALKADGTVVTWGSNWAGQCNTPAGLTDVTAVAAGAQNTMALTRAGQVVIWGGGVALPPSKFDPIDVAAGNDYTVVINADGTLSAWGNDWHGECNIPVGLTGVTAVAAGFSHMAALKNTGTVVAWGSNEDGQCNVPADLTNVIAVAAGGYHTVALKGDGTVAAWGANWDGRCNVPDGLTGVVAVDAGYGHTVALKADGTVVAWGDGSSGQCTIPDGLTGVTAIAAGYCHTVALKADGTVVAWGENSGGQCSVPAGLTGVVAIGAGDSHTVALKADGTVVVWGDNSTGQRSIPDGLTGVVTIAAGSSHTVALAPVTPLTAFALAPASVPDHLPIGTAVGRLTATGGAWPLTYTLVAGEGDTDNAAFSITGSALLTAAVFDYQVRRQYSIRVRATDSVGMTLEQAFTITVTEHNDPPSLQVPGLQTTTEDTSLRLAPATGASITLSDPDAGAAALLWVRLTAIDGTLTLPRLAGLALEEGTGAADRTIVVRGTQDALNAALGDVTFTPHTRFVGLTGLQITVDDQGNTGDGGPQSATATIPITVTPTHAYRVVGWGSNDAGQCSVPGNLSAVTAVAANGSHTVALKADGTVAAWGGNWDGQCNIPDGLTGVLAVAAGSSHSVALKADGTVVAWGANWDGQCNMPSGLTGVTAIAAGSSHTVALKGDGTVVTWGANWDGQCNTPAGLTGVIAIGAGSNYTLALQSNGTVVVWGRNWEGECNVPAGLTGVAAIAAGYYDVAAVKADGTVVTWGANWAGQADVPAGLASVVEAAAGYGHIVALKADGTVVGWGDNGYGQSTVPADLARVSAIAAGNSHTVALKESLPPSSLGLTPATVVEHQPIGTVVGTLSAIDPDQGETFTYSLVPGDGDGDNAAFTLADNVLQTAAIFDYKTRQTYYVRVRVTDGAGASLEQAFTITVTDRNDAPCLQVPGLQTTPEDTGLHLAPATGASITLSDPDAGAAALLRVRLTAIDGTLTLARLAGLTLEEGTGTADRTVVVSGTLEALNTTLGDITFTPRPSFVGLTGLQITADDQGNTGDGGPQATTATIPITVTPMHAYRVVGWGENSDHQCNAPSGLTGVMAVSGGSYHTVALKADGTVVAWGESASGYNDYGQCDVPAGLAGVIGIAAGDKHTVALKGDGTVVAWGLNYSGQCDVPAGLAGVVAVAAGASHTVALKADGTVVAWGYNPSGQCDVPAGLTGVVAIAAGTDHTVARKADGTVVAWGGNWNYQCSVPTGLTGVTAIAAGASHTVALKADGTVAAWGYNGYGQRTIPAGLTGVVAIAAGDNHTVALKGDGTVTAWGTTMYGTCPAPSGVTGLVAIAAGAYHTEALKVNEAPTGLTLSPATVAEDQPIDTVVGTLAVTDPDPGETCVYNLVPGEGDTDNAAFTIVGNALKTAVVFDREAKSSYTVRVRATDGIGASYEQTFTITIVAPPVVAPISDQVTSEGAPLTIPVMISDQDTPVAALTITVTSSNVALVPNTAANLAMALAGDHHALTITPLAGQAGTTVITIAVSDGRMSVQQRFTLTVVNTVNTVPAAGFGKALALDGPSDYASVPLVINRNFTIEFWFNSTQVVGYDSQWYNGCGLVDAEVSGVTRDFGVSLAAGKVVFGTGGTSDTSIKSGFLADGTWHHVAATRRLVDGQMELYIDGQRVATAKGSNANVLLTAASRICIGQLQTGFSNFNGKIDDVRMWSVVRTADQIQQNYLVPLKGNETGLVGYWPFEEGTGETSADCSTGSRPATLTNLGTGAWTSDGVTPTIAISNETPVTVRLGGLDLDNDGTNQADTLTSRIVSLPAAGTLYQVENGIQGQPIAVGDTVADSTGRVIYVPQPGTYGRFTIGYQVSDGKADSTNIATVAFERPYVPLTITPAPAAYGDVVVVTLACGDPGAVIHYTMDGSEPTVESPVYTAPITISATTQFHALAFIGTNPVSALVGGTYDLGDSYEADNTPATAKPIAVGETQQRSIHMPGNYDWITFTLSHRSAIQLSANHDSGDSMLYLYAADATTLITYDDDSGPGVCPQITLNGQNALAAGTYYAVVRAFYSNGTIPNYALTLTATSVPDAPTGLAGTYADNAVTLTWQDASDGEEGFNVYRDGKRIATVAAGATTVTDTTYTAHSTHVYTVRAYSWAGESEDSNQATVVTGTRFGLSIDDATLVEGNDGTAAMQFAVTLSEPSADPIVVTYVTEGGSATADTDYTTAQGTLTFAPGETAKTITVLVTGDKFHEYDEQFTVALSNQTPATVLLDRARATGTITNDDQRYALSIGDATLAEGNDGTAAMQFVVTLAAPCAEPVTVNYATRDYNYYEVWQPCATAGEDYTAVTGTLTFAPGETTHTIAVPVAGDKFYEGDEFFAVELSGEAPNYLLVDRRQASGVITNDDQRFALSIADAAVAEGNDGTTAMQFAVTLSNPCVEPVTVNYATYDGYYWGATAGTDYTAATGTLTFAPGETTHTISVLVNGDKFYESDELFGVELSGGAPNYVIFDRAQATGTIANDDQRYALSIADATVAEGHEGTADLVFTVTLSQACAETVNVSYATQDYYPWEGWWAWSGKDYDVTQGTLSFAPGETAKTIAVPVHGDRLYEGDEPFYVSLSAQTPDYVLMDRSQAIGTITNDDAVPDLVVEGLTLGQGGIVTDQEVQVAWAERNASTSILPAPWSTNVYLSSDATLSGEDRYLGSIRTTDPLAPGAANSQALAFTLNWDTVPAGDYYLIVTGDAWNEVNEGDREDNNTATLAVAVTTSPDAVAPETTITAGPASGSTLCASQVVFTYTGSDNRTPAGALTFATRVDGGAWSDFIASTSVDLSGLPEGQHTFEVCARDAAGNTDATPATCYLSIDLSGPVVQEIVATPDVTGIAVQWATNEPSSCRVEYQDSVTGGPQTVSSGWTQTAHRVVLTGLRPATAYTYRIVAADACGHETATTPTSMTTLPDTTAPTVTLTEAPWDGGILCAADSIRVAWTGTDNVTPPEQLLYRYCIDGNAWSDFALTAEINLAGLPDGQHVIEVMAQDAAGQTSATVVRHFAIDTSAPVLTQVASEAKAGMATITWDTDEPATSTVLYGPDATYGGEVTDGRLVTSHTVTLTGLAAEHAYAFRVRSTDACGHSVEGGDGTFTTGKDLYAPDTTIVAGPPQGGRACGTAVSLSWSGTDDVTAPANLRYQVKLDTEAWSAWASTTSQEWTGLADGAHSIQVRTQDAAGNIDGVPAVRSFWIDTVAPVISGIQVVTGTDRAVIAWQTDEPATSLVQYGDTAALGAATPQDAATVTRHVVTLTGLQPGTAYSYRVVSSDGCQESSSAVASFTTNQAPNLVVTGVTAPPAAGNGETIPVQWHVANAGQGDAPGSWVDRVYLSADAQPGDDTYLGIFAHTGTLSAGQGYDVTLPVALPARLTAGDYHLVVYTDYDNTVPEFAGEGDNTAVSAAACQVTLLPQPDLIPAQLTGAAEAIAGSPQTFTFTVTNRNAATTARTAWLDALYFSTDSVLDSQDVRLGIAQQAGVVATDGTYTVTITGDLPDVAYGDYYVLAAADSTDLLFESDETNNVVATPIRLIAGTPDLRAATVSQPVWAAPRQTIAITWTVESRGTGRAEGSWQDRLYLSTDTTYSADDLLLQSIPQQRTLSVGKSYTGAAEVTLSAPAPGPYYVLLVTDADGALTEGDEANNTVAAPLEITRLQSLLLSPDRSTTTVQEGGMVTGELKVTSLADVLLTGVTATATGGPGNLDVVLTVPPTIAAGQTVSLGYQITARDASILGGLMDLTVTSNEGISATAKLGVGVVPNTPHLTATPGSLDETMVRGEYKLLSLTVVNDGSATAKDVVVRIPATPWLRLVTPERIGDLPPGQRGTVTLALQPAAELELGNYTGNLVVEGQGVGVGVPFTFRALANATGSLVVYAEDEYTFFAADKPRVSGAKVRVNDQVSGAQVADGITDVTGAFTVPELREGTYRVEVDAEQHTSYQGTIYVKPGENTLGAFLSRELVRYTWTVEPTQVQDRYDISLQAAYETNVPAPVVVVEPAFVDLTKLTFDSTGKAVVDYTISNHGLIEAYGGKLTFDSTDDVTITPLLEDVGMVAAKSSIVVPVVFQRHAPTENAAPRTGSTLELAAPSGPCTTSGRFESYYVCVGPIEVRVPLWVQTTNCTGSVVPGDSGAGGIGSGWGTGWGGGGWSGPGVSVVNPTPTVEKKVKCCSEKEFKFDGNLDAISGLISSMLETLPLPSGLELEPKVSVSGNIKLCCLPDGSPSLGGTGTASVSVNGEYTWGISQGVDDALGNSDGLQNIQVKGNLNLGLRLRANASGTLTVTKPCGQESSVSGSLCLHLDGSAGLNEASLEATATDGQGHTVGGSVNAVAAIQTGGEICLKVNNGTVAMSGCFEGLYGNIGFTGSVGDKPFDYSKKIYLVQPYGKCSQSESSPGAKPSLETADYNPETDTVFEVPFADPFDEILRIHQAQEADKDAGVCARVKIQIDQRLTLTRNAFKATLEVENAPANVPLENMDVILEIRNKEGQLVNPLFGVRDPELTNVTDVTGTGTVMPGTTARAAWVLLPTRDAAPVAATMYTVGGTMSYTQNGTRISVPLYPAPITVMPDPLLDLHYFLVRDVYADDPFTPEVEPAEPFSLGLLLSNKGYGTAEDVHIVSAQPKIVENEKGLLIDFKITGTQVNDQEVSPTLEAVLGDIGPQSTAVAQWKMQASLQGKFVDYTATFNHVDGLGNPRLSLIDTVAIHELTHVVRVTAPTDDNKPDFLANDMPDEGHLPDSLYSSDGRVESVQASTTATTDGPVSEAHKVVRLTAAAASGLSYLRVDDPGGEDYVLVKVVRADGTEVRLGDNAWTTHRTIRKVGQEPYREHRLHLLDKDSTGEYTLYYEAARVLNTPPQAVDDTATAIAGVSTFINVLANDSDADHDPLLVTAVTQGAHGAVAIDANGYVIYAPAAGYLGGDRFTYTVADGRGGQATAAVSVTVGLANAAPEAQDGTLTVSGGATARGTFHATDPEGDALTFTLIGNDPAQGTVTLVDGATGAFTYTAAPHDGGRTTDTITFRVTDAAGNTDTGAVTVRIHPRLRGVSLAADQGTAQRYQQGISVTLTAAPEIADTEGVAYAFIVGEWRPEVEDYVWGTPTAYGPAQNYTLQPTHAGSYWVAVYARSIDGAYTVAGGQGVKLMGSRLTQVTLASTVAAPQPYTAGMTVPFTTALAAGDDELGVTYSYIVGEWDPATGDYIWGNPTAYGATKTYTLRPSHSGSYWVTVFARSADGSCTVAGGQGMKLMGSRLTQVTLTSAVPSSQPYTAGMAVPFTAALAPGDDEAGVTYSYFAGEWNPTIGDYVWAAPTAYSAEQTYTLRPGHSGSYWVAVYARSADGSCTVAGGQGIKVVGSRLTRVTLESAVSSPQPYAAGMAVPFTATLAPDDDALGVTYSYIVGEWDPAIGDYVWGTPTAYCAEQTYTLHPTHAGSYWVAVYARSADGACTVAGGQGIKLVATRLTQVTLTSAMSSPQPYTAGMAVPFTAALAPGDDATGVTYSYLVGEWNPAAGDYTWSIPTAYSAEQTYTLRPTHAGGYWVAVFARSADGSCTASGGSWLTIQ